MAAQTLTLLELRDRVYAQLRDDDHRFYDTDIVSAWLNDALTDIAARTKSIRREATGTQSDGTLAVPADFLEPVYLRLGTDDEVEFVDDVVFNVVTQEANVLGHTIGRYFAGNIDLYPAPDGDAYVLRYIALPAELTDDADVPEIEPQWHPRLVFYALAQAAYQAREDYRAQVFHQRYEAGLPALPNGNAKFIGPITLAPEPNVFDLRTERRHR